jgi:hypothetical protein
VGIFAAGLLLAACGPNTKSTGITNEKPTGHALHFTDLTPNLSSFLQQGSNDTCFNGGARPCAVLLRTQPKLDSEYVNVEPTQGHVDWPLESYGGTEGDQLQAVCYISDGQKITPFEGKSSSTYWYKVYVPMKRVLNQHVRHEAQQQSPGIETVRTHGAAVAVLAWASTEWFHQSKAAPGIPECE